MANIFDVLDPRGRNVFCEQECWDRHIVVGHSIMKGLEKAIEDAIRDPSEGIFQDKHKATHQVYYRRRGKLLTKVVVDFSDTNPGRVVTAFVTDNPKPGEIQIWP